MCARRLFFLIWLPIQGSNLGDLGQSQVCYHYTNGQKSPGKWSRRWGSNPQPPVYKTGALPLSYAGEIEIGGSGSI